MMAFSQNARVFGALVRRNLYVFRSQLRGSLIDGCAILLLDVLIFGYLFPTMGMAREMIAPVFLGNIIFILFMASFSFSYQILFDVEFTRQIDYYRTLPLTKRWFFATYVVHFVLQSFIITMPLIGIGSFLLRNRFAAIQPNIPLFMICYLLGLVFFATLFMATSFLFPFAWYRINVWPRILSPLLCLSSDLFPWQKLYDFWPMVANLFLLNPITHIVESLRITFVGGPQGLSLLFCLPMIVASISIALLLLKMGIQKRLDPV